MQSKALGNNLTNRYRKIYVPKNNRRVNKKRNLPRFFD